MFVFFKNHAENETGRLVPLYDAKAVGLQLSVNIYR